MTEEVQKTDDNFNLVLRWKNRRRMAWFSVVGMFILTMCLLFAPIAESKLNTIKDPITWYYFVSSGIVGAYMGFTTLEKFKLGK